MRKYGLWGVISIILMGIILLSACGTTTSTTTTQTFATTTQTSTTTSSSTSTSTKVYELKWAEWSPVAVNHADEIIQDIETRSEGRIKITLYEAQSLLQRNDHYRGIQSGVADIGRYVIGMAAGADPLNSIVTLPGLVYTTRIAGGSIYSELRNKFPELDQEYEKAGLKWIPMGPMPGTQIGLTSKKVVNTPSDVAGLRLIADPSWFPYLTSIKAVPQEVSTPDWFTALEKGMADGLVTGLPVMNAYKITGLFNSYALFGEVGLGSQFCGFFVNLEKWNSLPPDLQEIIVGAIERTLFRDDQRDLQAIDAIVSEAVQQGKTVTNVTSSNVQPWIDAAKPIVDDKIAKLEAGGQPNARQIYDYLVQLLNSYSLK
ncbi:MAG: TRAP transporter substrate-binding protein DctP [Dehalococcoidales bacterium]|nr:TRAP transporter substrate-binding protein DctP [Dehalococcoidales bacterium]